MLLQFELITCLWESLKLIISMISGLLNVSPSPRTNCVYLLRHQDTLKKSRTFSYMFGEYYLYNFRNLGNTCFVSKRRAPTNPNDPSNQFLEIFDMRAIYTKKHESTIW